jgi:arylsulfatase A-like enzyme
MVSHVDWLPTAAALAGSPVPPGLPGADLLAFKDGRWTPPEREAVALHVMKDDPPARPMIALRTQTRKLVRYLDTDDVIAFDLAADPGEERPLAVAGDAEHERLRKELDRWYAGEKGLAGIE